MDSFNYDRRWRLLVGLVGAIALLFLDQTILPVAIVSIQIDLDLSPLMGNWIINAYLLSMATFVLLGGYLGDKFGHKLIFLIGVVLFGASSVFSALSYNGFFLIIGRSIQGIAATFMTAPTMALILSAFPEKERGKAIAIYISIGACFLALGPLVGGGFTEYVSWRLIFWVNLPISILSFWIVCRNYQSKSVDQERIDWIGFLLQFVTLLALILVVMQGKDWGWDSNYIWILGLIFLLGLISFIIFEVKHPCPFIDLSLLQIPLFTGYSLLLFVVQFGFMITVFWVIFFQSGLHYSPFVSGLFTTIATAPIIFMSHVGNKLAQYFGSHIPIRLGTILVCFSYLWIGLFSFSASLWIYIPGLLTFGSGISFIFTQASLTATAIVEPNRRGIANGFIMTARQIGGTLGLAVFAAFMNGLRQFLFHLEMQKLSLPPNLVQSDQFDDLLVESLTDLSHKWHISEAKLELARKALENAYTYTFAWMNGLALVLGVIALALAFSLIKPYSLSKPSTSE